MTVEIIDEVATALANYAEIYRPSATQLQSSKYSHLFTQQYTNPVDKVTT